MSRNLWLRARKVVPLSPYVASTTITNQYETRPIKRMAVLLLLKKFQGGLTQRFGFALRFAVLQLPVEFDH